MIPSTDSRSAFKLLLLLFPAMLVSCAGQVPPPGGPVDVVPPEVVRTVPDTNAVRVTANAVELEFSKYVDRRSVEESIFISPYVGDLEFDWSGTSVVVRFSQPLRRNTTYVVNIGTDVRDRRAGNRMARGFTLAFATGDSIDRGSISGRVFDAKPEGVMIFAYALRGIDADTLAPERTRPDYIMQTGNQGFYTLSHIAIGPYRVFAIRDQYRNLVYDVQTDEYGVAPGDVVLTEEEPGIREVNFRLSQEDTTRPFLTAARAVDRTHLVVGFSEPMDSLSFGKGEFVVRDTMSGRHVDAAAAYLNLETPSAAGVLLSGPLDSGGTYRLIVRNVKDRRGNSVDTLHASEEFSGNGIPDTIKPRLSFSVKDSARGIDPGLPLRVTFSEPVDTSAVARAVALVDTGKVPVAAATQWLSPLEILLRPQGDLRLSSWYRLRVVMDSVRDQAGNTYRDSTARVSFQTLDPRTTGTLEGRVLDAGKGGGRIAVSAARTDATGVRPRNVTLDGPGEFLLDLLPEGMYGLSAYRDTDSSGTYSYGLPFPFTPSERFAAYPDTVKVRARWGVQGVEIRLK